MGYKFNPFTGNLDEVGAGGGGATSPGGSTTQLQFNDAGSFGGDVDLTWNKTTNLLTVAGDVNLNDGGTYTTTVQCVTPTANRTISFPDATGTVALVAGSSGQLLWNNAGANAGASTLTYDGSILTTSGRFINSYNATASNPAKVFTGTWFTGGTATTTKPHFLVEPTGTTSTAWSTSGTGLGVNAASGFAGRLFDFQVNGSSRAVLDSSGRLLVGTSSVVGTTYAGSNKFQLHNDGVAGAQIFTHSSTGSEYPAILELARSRGSLASPTAVIANDKVGACVFHGYDGANYIRTAAIDAVIDGTPGANDMPGSLVFSTTADGASSPTERMRITNDGKIYVNTTSAIGGSGAILHVNATNNVAIFKGATATQDVIATWNAATSGDNIFFNFGTEASYTGRGTIDYNRAAGQVRYNVTSDRRLKSDIQPAASALDSLFALQVRAYKWTETDYQVHYGFIAQELNEIVPDAVKVGDDGEEVTDAWSVDTGKLVPLLTKALQEAMERIETLEAKVAALEGV